MDWAHHKKLFVRFVSFHLKSPHLNCVHCSVWFLYTGDLCLLLKYGEKAHHFNWFQLCIFHFKFDIHAVPFYAVSKTICSVLGQQISVKTDIIEFLYNAVHINWYVENNTFIMWLCERTLSFRTPCCVHKRNLMENQFNSLIKCLNFKVPLTWKMQTVWCRAWLAVSRYRCVTSRQARHYRFVVHLVLDVDFHRRLLKIY